MELVVIGDAHLIEDMVNGLLSVKDAFPEKTYKEREMMAACMCETCFDYYYPTGLNLT